MVFFPWNRHFTFCLLGNVVRTLRCHELPLLWPEDRRTPPTASSRSCRRKQTEGNFTQLWKSRPSEMLSSTDREFFGPTRRSIQTRERRAGEDGSNLSDAGADCRDRTLVWWADWNFYWMSDGANKSMWTEYKTNRLQERKCQSMSTDWALCSHANPQSLCNQAHCEWEKTLKYFIQH